jgi:hypothetical protein
LHAYKSLKGSSYYLIYGEILCKHYLGGRAKGVGEGSRFCNLGDLEEV